MLLPLAVVWERSRGLLAGLLLAHAAACSGVLLSGLPWPWRIAGLLGVLAALRWSIREWQGSAGDLEISGPGEAVLNEEGARIRVVAIRHVTWPWLAAADLQYVDGRSAGRVRRIVVFADALDAETFRRFRLCLRVGLLRPVADRE